MLPFMLVKLCPAISGNRLMSNTATLSKEALQNAYLTSAWRRMCCVGGHCWWI